MSIVLPRPHLGSGVELFESALTVPYAAGMRTETIELRDGVFDVAGPRRDPVLLVRIRRGLASEAVVVVPSIGDDELTPVVFAPFSAEGTLLLAFRPALAAGSDGTGDFAVNVVVHRVVDESRLSARPDFGAALDDEDAADLVEGVVMEGRMARLLYLGTIEKQRCIRQAREIAAMRHRTLAHSSGLDDRGRDLGVPRLVDLDEPDESYKARLAIYSSWRIATPTGFESLLNGPGEADEPNAGPLSLVGVTDRFEVVEQINDLSVATKLVAVGPDGVAQLDAFHETLRAAYLVDLDAPPPEMLPETRRQLFDSVRSLLDDQLTRSDGSDKPRYMAPLVALTLDRAVRLLRTLGYSDPIRLARAYDPDGGSRYELGLGIDISPMTAVQLELLAEAVDDIVDEDDDLGLLAESLEPRSAEDDPLGRWMFEACGFRTVHLLENGNLHLSPLPTFGQWIDGPTVFPVGASATYEARYHSSGENVGVHVLAHEARADASATFAAVGLGALPTALAPAELTDVLTALADVEISPSLPALLGDAAADGLLAVDSKALASQLISNFNLDQVIAFVVTKTQLDALGSEEEARDALFARASALIEAGFYSVRGVWDDDNGRLLLLASVSQLPGSTGKLGEPPAASYYWYETRLPKPIVGTDDPVRFIQRRGGKATLTTGRTGLALVACIGYARRGLADPFEVRVELPDPDALLTAEQYGYLMNLLEFVYPIGIEINTFDIRRSHVDVDGDGNPEFLTSRASRTYHRYQHRRAFGSGRGREQRGQS